MLTAFLALYLVDVAGFGAGGAALGLAVWAGAGLVGDGLAVPMLDRFDGGRVVRITAGAAAGLYAAMLVVEPRPAKVVLLAMLGLSTVGWYPVLLARYYATMPGRSGVAVSFGSASGILAGIIPLGLGLVAERFGLAAMMWLLLIGPLVLIVGLRRAPDPSAAADVEEADHRDPRDI